MLSKQKDPIHHPPQPVTVASHSPLSMAICLFVKPLRKFSLKRPIYR